MTSGRSWRQVRAEAPDLAAYVERRFGAHEHHVMATVRRDGRPRVSGTNVMLTDELAWVGMMTAAGRLHDLRGRPWCAIHSAPLDTELRHGSGDVRLDATVRELPHGEASALLGERADGGVAFELLVTTIEVIEVDGEQLMMRRWSPHAGERLIRVR